MPAALIARLAADERTRGSGLRVGETLLIDAFARIAGVAEAIGCLGVVTDAKNDKAEAFYQKYDFATVEEKKWPRRMFLPIRTVWSLFE
jgi:ribosomal protein S18 acetylase RimI-like enzyme